MDEIARYNIARWKALADANALFTRPALDLDTASARRIIDPESRYGDLENKDVLCLASGGGKQSAAFGILGANVTVLDLSVEQLNRDRAAAEHYGLEVRTIQGDIRDLSVLEAASFDVVCHGYSLGFVPEALPVFQQVARVIRKGGIYTFGCANPFSIGLSERDWNGEGYSLKHPYVDGAELSCPDQEWVYDRSRHAGDVPPSREYRHTLSTLVRGLIETGFVLLHISDYTDLNPDPEATPGTWDHFVSISPPWLSFWTRFEPDALRQINQAV